MAHWTVDDDHLANNYCRTDTTSNGHRRNFDFCVDLFSHTTRSSTSFFSLPPITSSSNVALQPREKHFHHFFSRFHSSMNRMYCDQSERVCLNTNFRFTSKSFFICQLRMLRQKLQCRWHNYYIFFFCGKAAPASLFKKNRFSSFTMYCQQIFLYFFPSFHSWKSKGHSCLSRYFSSQESNELTTKRDSETL